MADLSDKNVDMILIYIGVEDEENQGLNAGV